jgi:hypothetical protein
MVLRDVSVVTVVAVRHVVAAGLLAVHVSVAMSPAAAVCPLAVLA